uniref:1-Cys peroxiredoxin n=2 Tax=Ascaris TaxID=6251 RepID=A0A9J2PCI1_ASCLU
MPLLLGDAFPDFTAETNEGTINSFHQWIGEGNWAILFSHPHDFTPVCTTELARAAQLYAEFNKRNVKMIALSCDSAQSHREWIPDICAYCKAMCGDYVKGCCANDQLPFPIIADESRILAKKLGMIDPVEKDCKGDPVTARCVFVIGPERTLKLSILYPATTGRNFDEILRVVDSLQLTAQKNVATPVDWKAGDCCVVSPSMSDEAAKATFGSDMKTVKLPSGKHYLRMVPHPK